MKKILLTGSAALAVAAIALVTIPHGGSGSASAAGQGAAIVEVTLPDGLSPEAAIGKRAFDAVCAACHGDNAAGRDGFGPPLVHRIYEPSHHGDRAFFMAVEQGVRSHHWRFGNMPPLQGLTRADVAGIVTYVRELQRANGID